MAKLNREPTEIDRQSEFLSKMEKTRPFGAQAAREALKEPDIEEGPTVGQQALVLGITGLAGAILGDDPGLGVQSGLKGLEIQKSLGAQRRGVQKQKSARKLKGFSLLAQMEADSLLEQRKQAERKKDDEFKSETLRLRNDTLQQQIKNDEAKNAISSAKVGVAELAANNRKLLAQSLRQRKEEQVEEKKEIQRTDKINKEVAKLSDKADKSGLVEIVGALNIIKRDLDTQGAISDDGSINIKQRDLEGFGTIAGSLPDIAVSEKARDLRGAVESLRNILLKARSGGAVTPEEGRRLAKELGVGTPLAPRSERQLLIGLQRVEEKLRDKIRNFYARATPDAVNLFNDRRGSQLSIIGTPEATALDDAKTLGLRSTKPEDLSDDDVLDALMLELQDSETEGQ